MCACEWNYTCPKCRPDREREIDGDPPTRDELERLPYLAEKPTQEWSANG